MTKSSDLSIDNEAFDLGALENPIVEDLFRSFGTYASNLPVKISIPLPTSKEELVFHGPFNVARDLVHSLVSYTREMRTHSQYIVYIAGLRACDAYFMSADNSSVWVKTRLEHLFY